MNNDPKETVKVLLIEDNRDEATLVKLLLESPRGDDVALEWEESLGGGIERLKRGGTTLKQVLVDAESDEALAKLKVSALLESLPGVGKVRAAALMEQFEIAPSRRVRGLGERQRQALLNEFGY